MKTLVISLVILVMVFGIFVSFGSGPVKAEGQVDYNSIKPQLHLRVESNNSSAHRGREYVVNNFEQTNYTWCRDKSRASHRLIITIRVIRQGSHSTNLPYIVLGKHGGGYDEEKEKWIFVVSASIWRNKLKMSDGTMLPEKLVWNSKDDPSPASNGNYTVQVDDYQLSGSYEDELNGRIPENQLLNLKKKIEGIPTATYWVK